MAVRFLYDIKDMIVRELEDISGNGEINGAKELDAIDKLTHSLKSVETIIAMNEAGYPNRGSGYSRGRNRQRDSRWRRTSYDDGDGTEQMMDELHNAMQNAQNEETKEAIKKAIQMMEKEQQ